ncbi:MAG: pectate lyase [Pirellulales bacterium]|nr:pectate lyase [Pirellulales bacterium]
MRQAPSSTNPTCFARNTRWFTAVPAAILMGALSLIAAVSAEESPAPNMEFPAKDGFGQAPAFPGAEGFAKYTEGGRHGRVLLVTTLEDYDPDTETPIAGSLRKAIEADGPRTVLFRVSGTIELKSALEIYKPFLTLAGQSAPGNGICLKNYGVSIRTSEVVIRYLRFRPGDEVGKRKAKLGEPFSTDALQVYAGDWAAGRTKPGFTRNVIIDHCSFSWGTDETVSIPGIGTATQNTVQWCLVSEALNNSTHHKGPHGFGSIVNGKDASVHHNLYAHLTERAPAIGADVGDFRNNVIYDAKGFGSGNINYVGNYIRRGAKPFPFWWWGPGPHLADNWVEGADGSNQQSLLAGFQRQDQKSGKQLPRETPHNVPAWAQVATQPAKEAFERVLAEAGATLPKRDAVDQRLIEQVRLGTGKIIDSQDEVGGWPELKSAAPPKDSNNDGMPDDWQIRYGLDPHSVDPGPAHNDALWYPNNEASRDLDKDGYTNLEEYLNGTDPTRPDTDLAIEDPEPTPKWTPPRGWFRGYDLGTHQHTR